MDDRAVPPHVKQDAPDLQARHAIRLRGPWELQALQSDRTAGTLPPAGRTRVPGDWGEMLGADFVGRARYTRSFNCPTNLGPQERVWLAIDAVDLVAEVALNGQPLGRARLRACPWRADVTARLCPHNVLLVEVSLPLEAFADAELRGARAGRAGGLVGEVRLEIG